ECDQERAYARERDADFHYFVPGDQVRGQVLEYFEELARARRRVICRVRHGCDLFQRLLVNPSAEATSPRRRAASKLEATSTRRRSPTKTTGRAELVRPLLSAKSDSVNPHSAVCCLLCRVQR